MSKILEKNDIPSLAKYIASGRCKKIVLMLGAGVSTSAGIPDFRSPKTGLYANLARLNLPYPEAVFEINFFRRNPVPFYTLAHELYPGKFRPTLTHSFVRLLAAHSLLQVCFTQNIDTLERIAGVPDHLIIEAHGSFASQHCINCHKEFDSAEMKRFIEEKKIVRCAKCKGLVKPDIVFFGESLPEHFISAIPSVRDADLLIIIGTSLTVHPFASLAGMVDRQSCPRVLINLERVGDLGSRRDDVVLLGKCDDLVRELCRELGWEAELEQLWAATRDDKRDGEELKEEEKEKKEEKEKVLEKEVENLAAAISERFDLGEGSAKEDSKTKEAPESESSRQTGQLKQESGTVDSSPKNTKGPTNSEGSTDKKSTDLGTITHDTKGATEGVNANINNADDEKA